MKRSLLNLAALLFSTTYLVIQYAAAQQQISSNNCACPGNNQPVCAGGKSFRNPCFAQCAGFATYRAITGNTPCGVTPEQTGVTPPKPQNTPAPARTAAGGGSGAKPCACPREFNPVCGVDGAFFPNKCLANCVGTKVSDKKPKDGKCGHVINGQQQPKPQQNQQKPPQKQQSKPAGGTSVRDCSCSQDVNVVCGKANNKVTNYANACVAKCLGAQVLYDGACKPGTSGNAGPAANQGVINGVGNNPPPQQSLEPLNPNGAVAGPQLNPGGLLNPGPSAYAPEPVDYMQPAVQCRCPRLRLRVCAMAGPNYVTVVNSCSARCYGLPIAHLGKCRDRELMQNQGAVAPGSWGSGGDDDEHGIVEQPASNCVCPMIYAPVCAGGRTFSNRCVARCNGYPLALASACLLAK